MRSSGADLERADQLLRAADPVSPDALAGAGDARVARAALARILSERPGNTARRGAHVLPRVARAAVGVLAAVALIALMGALVLFVRGGGDATTANVAAPPIHYGIFDRPQTPEEAVITGPQAPLETYVPDTIRIADSAAGNRYILAKTPAGAICRELRGARGGAASGCSEPGRPHVSFATGTFLDNAHIAYGLVPDGIVEVAVNGHAVPVVGNVFHADLDPLTARAVIDYRTAEGVVQAWREAIPTVLPPTPPVKVEAFDSQARLLQTRPPYLGVRCPNANSFACDRVGLSVWLRKPALTVVAKIAGRRVVLDDPTWSGPVTNGRRRRFAGFLHPAGLLDGPLRIATRDGGTRWTGVPPVAAKVIIIVTYRMGSASTAVMRVPLSPGWG